MASSKYGCITPGAHSQMLPVAASQYFYHNGVNAVHLDSSGLVTLSLTATATLYGIAIVPAGMGAGSSNSYWKSSAAAGADQIAVIPVSEQARFLIPTDATITRATHAGNAYDLVAVNDGSATYLTASFSTTNVFIIDAPGTDIDAAYTTDAIIKLNPATVQADT
jgi:hypothetical protein